MSNRKSRCRAAHPDPAKQIGICSNHPKTYFKKSGARKIPIRCRSGPSDREAPELQHTYLLVSLYVCNIQTSSVLLSNIHMNCFCVGTTQRQAVGSFEIYIRTDCCVCELAKIQAVSFFPLNIPMDCLLCICTECADRLSFSNQAPKPQNPDLGRPEIGMLEPQIPMSGGLRSGCPNRKS